MTAGNKVTRKKAKSRRPSDSEMLEEVLQGIHEKLKEKGYEPKVADFLKVLEMKYKLKLTDDGRQKLLDLIESARQMELGGIEEDTDDAD
jgi:hypothetical protein